MTPQQLAAVIDHTFLKTGQEGVAIDAQQQAIDQLLAQAHQHGAYSVCVRSHWVRYAATQLQAEKSAVKVVSVVGFPRGDDFPTAAIIEEAQQAIVDGAAECDMVIKLELFHQGRLTAFQKDIIAIANALPQQPLKVIVENALLPQQQKTIIYRLVCDAIEKSWQQLGQRPIRFLKTSTGFAQPLDTAIPSGATLADIKLMKMVVQDDLGLKAAGGVDDIKAAIAYWQAAGTPKTASGQIDPCRFRIGSSRLLTNLFQKSPSLITDY